MTRVIKVLFIAANPSDTPRLRLDEEVRAIDQALCHVKFREKFSIQQHWAVRVADLQACFLGYMPDIVHFSGHGSISNEIILEDNSGNRHPVSISALSRLFAILKDNIRCVVLNTCYSEQQARAIAEHIDCVIGMSKAIGDTSAINFAAAFYQALGYGRNVKTAFDLGCLELDLKGLNEQDTPRLLALNSNPEEIVFVSDTEDSIHPGTSPRQSLTTVSLGNAPPFPELIIGRENALDDLKARLGIVISGHESKRIQILTTIRGWPGVGKTTIAAALAHDPDIDKAFPDGILWISLGPKPDLLSGLAIWASALGIKISASLGEAFNQLAGLLRNKRMFLIVDDVWEPEHAKLFNIGGRGCATLITTRSNSVAQALASTPNDVYLLDVLSDEKALELLQTLAPTVVEKYPNQSIELVHELEGLPLALQVAGRLLHVEASYGFSVINLLVDLREGTKLLKAKAPVDQINVASETTLTVAALLQKSTDRLDNQTRDCFAYLGIFAPKPASFDLPAMKHICKVEDPKPIARSLVDRGLLEFISETGRYQMHALLVLHAKSLLIER